MRRIEGSEDIGKQIRDLRKAQNLSLAELAKRIRASATHLSQIETGKVTNPGTEILSRIATALGVPFSIVGNDSKAEKPSGLVYASPFSIEDLQESDTERKLADLINDLRQNPELPNKERERIFRNLLSYAGWLRDEALRADGD